MDSNVQALPASRAAFRVSRVTLFEIVVLIFAVSFYAAPLLNFDPSLILYGGEYQAHVGSVVPFLQWIKEGAEFPLWNPILENGRSLIADPLIFAFNPFVTIPMIVWGVINGTKIAVALNFFIAALGVWLIGKLLNFEMPTRLWTSLLYAFSGALSAHLNVGQIQLTFALGWLPWSIAGVLWVVKSRGYTPIVFASLAQAIFFFAGNLYYQVYGVVCLALIVVVFLIEVKPLRLNLDVLRRTFLLGLFSIGLTAIHLFTFLSARPEIHNFGGYAPNEEQFLGSQTPVNALLNYVIADRDFINSSMLDRVPFLQESYRYIGITPFLFLLLLVPAAERGRRREIIALVVCFVIILMWAALRYTFFKDIYHAFPPLAQFRFPGRALSVGALFLILLGGFGLDQLWRWLQTINGQLALHDGQGAAVFTLNSRIILLTLILVGVGFAVADEFAANQQWFALDRFVPSEADAALAWLRDHDRGEYALRTTSAVTTQRALTAYEKRLRYVDLRHGWEPAGTSQLLGHPNAITLQPKYWVIWKGEDTGAANLELLKEFEKAQIWQAREAFPFAFLILNERMNAAASVVAANEVIPATQTRREGPNRIVAQTQADAPAVLVISESWFSGWKVTVDGREAALASVSNLLAVQLPAGAHTVTFQYDPLSFRIGLMVSGLTLALAVGLLIYEWRHPPGS
jgi:hypothetical protein